MSDEDGKEKKFSCVHVCLGRRNGWGFESEKRKYKTDVRPWERLYTIDTQEHCPEDVEKK